MFYVAHQAHTTAAGDYVAAARHANTTLAMVLDCTASLAWWRGMVPVLLCGSAARQPLDRGNHDGYLNPR